MKLVINALRAIFGFIDTCVYGLIQSAFRLILDLANVEIFSSTVINDFANRIYIILGLVMIFKLMISFIQIIVNPDKMDDNEKGVGNVLKRVIVSLVLIVLVPSIFDMARTVQNYLVPVIPRVILGTNDSTSLSGTEGDRIFEITTEQMAFYSFLPFFGYDNASCNDGSIYGTTSTDGSNAVIYNVATAVANINKTDPCSNDENGYKYEYRIVLSTLVGGYMLFVLVQIAVKIAIRAIKFGICEFVAPIPIASYIDPKTSSQTFSKWVSTCFKTYADLFIRLILLYFIIFVFMEVFKPENVAVMTDKLDGNLLRISFVMLFIIMGLLLFAKEAPKFISDMLGIPDGGDMMGMFKGEGIKDMKNALGGLAGMAAAPISSAMSNYNYNKRKLGKGHALLGAVRGLGSGFVGATKAAVNGEGFEGAYNKTKQAVTTANMRSVIGAANRRRDKRNFRTARDQYKTDMKAYEADTATLAELHEKYAAAETRANESWTQYLAAKKRGDKSAEMMHKNNYDNAKTTMNLLQRKMREVGTPKEPVAPTRPSSYGLGRAEAAVKSFTGTPIPTSATYTKAAGYMSDAKKLFNDAKSKVTEAPTLITESLTFKDKSGNSYGGGTFADIHNALQQARNSSTQTATLNGQNLSVSELETIYGEALKDASVIYMNKVKSGEITNNVLLRGIEAVEDHLDNDLVLSKGDAERVKAARDRAIAANSIGDFYKSADDFAGDFTNTAQDLSRVENNEES